MAAKPEKAADLKPATRCVLNGQRGKQGSLLGGRGGGIPAFYSNCDFLCCAPGARNDLFKPLAFQRCCTNTGVHKKLMTFSPTSYNTGDSYNTGESYNSYNTGASYNTGEC